PRQHVPDHLVVFHRPLVFLSALHCDGGRNAVPSPVATFFLLCKSTAKVPCAVSDGTAWNFSAWAGDGLHGRNFMCRSLLPVIVVRPRHMKFFARRGSDQRMRVENTGIQRYKEVRRKRLPFPQGQRQPDVNYILAVSFSLPGRDGTEFFYLSFMRPCGAA